MKKKQNILCLIKVLFFLILFFSFSCYKVHCESNPFLSKKDSSNSSPYKKTTLIIFDASGSMEEKINGETKIRIAKKVLEEVLMKAPLDINIGLRVYGASGFFGSTAEGCADSKLLVEPAANNRRTIITSLNNAVPTVAVKGNGRGLTPISFSLVHAINDLASYSGERSVILISDGAETCAQDPCEVAQEFVKKNIDVKIDVVGFDVERDYYAQKQLMCVALSTKGRYFQANDGGELLRSLQESFITNVTGRVIVNPEEKIKQEPVMLFPLPLLEAEMISGVKK